MSKKNYFSNNNKRQYYVKIKITNTVLAGDLDLTADVGN